MIKKIFGGIENSPSFYGLKFKQRMGLQYQHETFGERKREIMVQNS